MRNKNQISEEAKEIYFAIKEVMVKSETDHCQSWWINTRNFALKSKLSTPKINQRAKLLVKQGYLIIDPKNTSRSRGTCYKLTDKKYN